VTPPSSRLVPLSSVVRNTRVPEPVPRGFAGIWIARYEQGRRDETRDGFALEDEDEEFLRLALIPRIEREALIAELGYLVVPQARGRGVATEALRLLTELAFTELDLVRLELMIAIHNQPSKIVAQRCGYVREGVLRSVYFKQGRREDTEVWSRLARDPV
jgi:RimJ/RimL family protein N-acetyltransferase